MFDDLTLPAQDEPTGETDAGDGKDTVRIHKTGSMSPPKRPKQPQRPPSRR